MWHSLLCLSVVYVFWIHTTVSTVTGDEYTAQSTHHMHVYRHIVWHKASFPVRPYQQQQKNLRLYCDDSAFRQQAAHCFEFAGSGFQNVRLFPSQIAWEAWRLVRKRGHRLNRDRELLLLDRISWSLLVSLRLDPLSHTCYSPLSGLLLESKATSIVFR